MDRKTFWDIVAEANAKPRSARRTVLKRLAALPPEEILSFRQVFDDLVGEAYRNDLWGAGYLINGGCSDDGFHYFCEGLVEQGQQIYEAAVRNPDSLADVVDSEELAYESGGDFEAASREAWMKKTRRSETDYYAALEALASSRAEG